MNKKETSPDLTRFIPTSRAEMAARGWDELDVLFVSGDAYVDHPSFGVPLLARMLEAQGLRVGILAQPDWREPEAFKVMGRPRLCAAISAGAMDSMVNHYTAAKKKRRDDAYTPGGQSGARPNRAVIAYTAAVRGAFKGLPVVIGGIEASLRRLAHYDYWSDRVRRSVLVDSKADLLIYGMGERPLLELVEQLRRGQPISQLTDIPGTAWLTSKAPAGVVLPDFAAVENDAARYAEAFALAEKQGQNTLVQGHGQRFVVVNPQRSPWMKRNWMPCTACHLYGGHIFLTEKKFRRLSKFAGPLPATAAVRGCAFCAIARHQGRRVQSRSEESVVDEARQLVADAEFRGTISDVGGPTANMYGTEVKQPQRCHRCQRTSCLHPAICSNLQVNNGRGARLLRRVRQLKGVKHLFVASGVRYDLLERQSDYERELFDHHVGGLLKVAPEALSNPLLQVMRKPAAALFGQFVERFRAHNRRREKRCGIVPYLMAGHPGSSLSDMVDTALFLKRYRLRVEQVQEFTPTPGTLATCIYHTGMDPFSGQLIKTTYSERERRLQKALLLYHQPQQRQAIREALRLCGREQDGAELLGGQPQAISPKRSSLPASRSRRKSKRPLR